MRKRDRFRAFLAPSATGARSASPHSVPPQPLPLPAQRASTPPLSSAANLIAPHTVTSTRTSARNPALKKAVELQLQQIPEPGRASFAREIEILDEQALLSKLRAYDSEHKNDSSFRPHAERLTKGLGLLNRLMGGVAIGIQADPAISAPVVGAVRVAIDLGLHFTKFFPRLTDMVCELEDYLGPLAEHARAADVELVESAVVSVYVNILDFSWKARCVFVDTNGERRKWTSFRAFMRQHWDTFEAEFVSIKEDMQHHLYVLQHAIQATHFSAFRSAEQRKERSEFLKWVSDIDFEEVHQSIYARKHKDTGDWLIRELKFQEWMQSPHSSLLWCNGKPGIGNSNVLEHITAEAGLRKDTAICFAYYDYRDTRLANVTRIIATLIKQLCQRRYDIPNNLLRIMHDARSPSLVGSQQYFLALAEGFSEIFVVFDALDECPEQKRQDILDFVTEVILAENVAADIESFARSKVEELQAKKMLYVTKDELKERIVQTLATKAEGIIYNVPTLSQRWIDQTPPMYALHLAASAGLTSAVIRLLEGGCDIDEKDRNGNAPLYHTSLNGHLDVVRSLLDEGAEVNARGGYYGNALYAASEGGHEQIVKMLLDKDADVNAQGGEYGNALQAASSGGHEQVVKMLLDKDADVNAQGGLYGNALQAASEGGHEQVVKMLLDKDADVNAQGGEYGNALQAASHRGHEQ
ncbi:hypothetical protein G6514_004686, partial [Epicoccum nigrum]